MSHAAGDGAIERWRGKLTRMRATKHFRHLLTLRLDRSRQHVHGLSNSRATASSVSQRRRINDKCSSHASPTRAMQRQPQHRAARHKCHKWCPTVCEWMSHADGDEGREDALSQQAQPEKANHESPLWRFRLRRTSLSCAKPRGSRPTWRRSSWEIKKDERSTKEKRKKVGLFQRFFHPSMSIFPRFPTFPALSNFYSRTTGEHSTRIRRGFL